MNATMLVEGTHSLSEVEKGSGVGKKSRKQSIFQLPMNKNFSQKTNEETEILVKEATPTHAESSNRAGDENKDLFQTKAEESTREDHPLAAFGPEAGRTFSFAADQQPLGLGQNQRNDHDT